MSLFVMFYFLLFLCFILFQDFFIFIFSWESKTILDPHCDQPRLSKLFVQRNSMHFFDVPVTSRVSMRLAYNKLHDSVRGTELFISKVIYLNINIFCCVFANASRSHLANSISIIKYTLLQWLMYGSLPSKWMCWLHSYRISLRCFIWLGDCLIIYKKWNVFTSLTVFKFFKRIRSI